MCCTVEKRKIIQRIPVAPVVYYGEGMNRAVYMQEPGQNRINNNQYQTVDTLNAAIGFEHNCEKLKNNLGIKVSCFCGLFSRRAWSNVE